jgi:hypothetical protein
MSMRIYLVFSFLFASHALSAQSNLLSKKENVTLTEARRDSLTKDLLRQMPDLNSKVNWTSTSFGAQATFDMGYEQHISLFDKAGHYIETLKKSAWSKDASPTLLMGFETSIYGLLPVLTFWENISLDETDYFFQLLDTDGKTKELWADANGNFFESPLFVK